MTLSSLLIGRFRLFTKFKDRDPNNDMFDPVSISADKLLVLLLNVDMLVGYAISLAYTISIAKSFNLK